MDLSEMQTRAAELEQQISALFINMFGFNIDNLVENKFSLGDLVESVDNRGKTPPLSDKPTSYPIIDVKALSGDIRIVDYNNCTKYVDDCRKHSRNENLSW